MYHFSNELIFIAESIVVTLSVLGFSYFGSAGLFSFVSLSWVVGNLFISKEIILFGLPIISTDVFAVGVDFAIALLRENYGKKEAKRAVSLGVASALFFAVVSQFLLWFTPSPHDLYHPHFAALLTSSPRIMLASATVSFCCKFLSIFILTTLARLLPTTSFTLRTLIAISIAQLIDTIAFSFCALYGSVESIWSIVVFSYVIKLLSLTLCVTLLGIVKRAHNSLNLSSKG